MSIALRHGNWYNTFIEPGNRSFAEIIKDIEQGEKIFIIRAKIILPIYFNFSTKYTINFA
ncbi:hypothetical protein [Hydrocoleum sp. CS-953]|uniref:hypothetical protein n=1 Tax=Hydrocoleum sp. CS-953 TaxID=1671698 RepID=UPI001179E76B|nr:hypothetical protein [Hydrocoleum sp. CS-953]